MQFTHKLLSCQKKLVNDFIHFKFCLNNCLIEFLSFNDHLFFFYHKQHDLIQALVYFVQFCDSRFFFPIFFLKLTQYHCFYMKQNEIFLVDSLMCLTKHFLIALEISKSSLSGSNLLDSYLFLLYCFFPSYFMLNISFTLTMNFYCVLMVMKTKFNTVT